MTSLWNLRIMFEFLTSLGLDLDLGPTRTCIKTVNANLIC